MRPGLVLLATLVAAANAVGAQATQAPCPGAPTPVLFADTEFSLENLAFDGHGHLFVSDAGGDRILRFLPDASSTTVLQGPVNGILWGPDDRLYAAVGDGHGTWDIRRSTDANVTAFTVYSSGLPVYNGLAFDAAGNLYVSDDNIAPPETPPDLVRIPAADPMHWQEWSPVYGPDGLVYDAARDVLYTVVPADQSSPVLRLSTTDPSKVEVVTHLSFGAVSLAPGAHPPQGDPTATEPKGLDDLALGPDGLLYIAGHLSGEILRVDPATGAACVLASGLMEPSSVRIAHGFGAFGGKLFVTTFGGTGVSGLALGQAGMPPPGQIWVLDVGFVEQPANGTVTAPEPTPTPRPIDDFEAPTSSSSAAKGSPSPGVTLLALGLLSIVALRRKSIR